MTLFVSRPGLLPRFRGGERAALEEVYRAYVEPVERVIRGGFLVVHKNVRVAGASEVLDLVQETFARAFAERARLAYDGIRPYRPFIITIARNLLVNRARTLGRDVPLDALPEEPPANDETAWAEPAVLAAVDEYIGSLAPALRGVHEQRYVLRRGQEEAAGALGLTRQKLRTLEGKLRGGLAELLRARGLDS